MKMSKVGQHTVRCMITEEEIEDLGYSLDEIMSNGSRTQEFMNYIFGLAEKEFSMKFQTGVRTVRADFMPDHTLSLTFSELSPENLMEHLKDIVTGLIGSAGPAREALLEEQKDSEGPEDGREEEPAGIPVLLLFDSLTAAIDLAGRIPEALTFPSALYRLEDTYYLWIDLTEASAREVLALSCLTDEYVELIEAGDGRCAYIAEHGKRIIRGDAIQELRAL